MAEYIERETAIKRVQGTGYADQIKDNLLVILRTIPAADVEPVRPGQWIEDDDGDGRHCSECGQDYCYIVCDAENYHYCPKCGCRMDGEVDGHE